MANQEHRDLLLGAKEKYKAWRESHPEIVVFDLSDSEFTDLTIDSDRFDSHKDTLNLSGCVLKNCNFNTIKLNILDLTASSLFDCRIGNSRINTLKLVGSQLTDTKIESNDIILEVAGEKSELYTCHLSFNKETTLNFAGSEWHNVQLTCKNTKGTFVNSEIFQSSFIIMSFDDVDFCGALLHEVKMIEVNLNTARNLRKTKGLETTLPYQQGRELVLQFEKYNRAWPERFFSWENLRTFGRLPLFGASYLTLITIPIYCYGIAWYNKELNALKKATEKVDVALDGTATAGTALDRKAHDISQYVNAIHSAELPGLTFCLFFASILLAIASTIYATMCPTRIKEFSKDVWCDQLNRPLIHYWPISWKNRPLRLVCGVFYLVGGALASIVIVKKVFTAGAFIIEQGAW
jgi:hypothetical protein